MKDNLTISNFVLAFAIVFLLLLFVYLDGTEASEARLRYTLIDKRASFLFSNYDSLPFTINREMCWNDVQGFCDVEGSTDELYTLIDWQMQAYGAIYEDESGACFWWMYQAEWGEDGNPHVAEHYWITCPTLDIPEL